jgi:hypothetical protein
MGVHVGGRKKVFTNMHVQVAVVTFLLYGGESLRISGKGVLGLGVSRLPSSR